jgi:membrane protease YdiL (CAAX protease family)
MGAVGLGRIENAREQPRTTRKLAGWLALIAALAAGNYAARFEGGNPPKDVLYHWDNVVGGAVQFLVILGIALYIARGAPELRALRRPHSWAGALGIALAVLVGVYALSAILGPILHPGREQGLTPDHWDSSRAAPFFANAVLICVLAPFVEEITFRGVGFGLLRARFGVEPAIVGSAVLFGLAHGLVEALPLLVAFGIGLAWLRERQGSTIPGMILHGTFNAIALAASLLL